MNSPHCGSMAAPHQEHLKTGGRAQDRVFEHVVDGQDAVGHLVGELEAEFRDRLLDRLEMIVEGAARHRRVLDDVVDHGRARGAASGAYGKYRLQQLISHPFASFPSDAGPVVLATRVGASVRLNGKRFVGPGAVSSSVCEHGWSVTDPAASRSALSTAPERGWMPRQNSSIPSSRTGSDTDQHATVSQRCHVLCSPPHTEQSNMATPMSLLPPAWRMPLPSQLSHRLSTTARRASLAIPVIMNRSSPLATAWRSRSD